MTVWVWSGYDAEGQGGSGNVSWSDPNNWAGLVVPTVAVGDTVSVAPVGYIYQGGYIYVSELVGVSGSLVNSGTINLSYGNYNNSHGQVAGTAGMQVALVGDTTISGGGVVNLTTLTDGQGTALALAGITGSSGVSATLENVDNTFQGGGVLGGGYFGTTTGFLLKNDAKGVIDASDAQAAMILSVATADNAGVFEATGAAGLSISAHMTIDQSGGGTILAKGGNVNFVFENAVTGGTLGSSGGGEIISSGLTLDGTGALPVTISAGSLLVENNVLYLAAASGQTGQIVNHGTIQVGVAGSAALNVIFGAVGPNVQTAGGIVRLSGGGELAVNAGFSSGPPSSGTLFDNVDNSIVGALTVTSNIENDAKGVIDATSASYLKNVVVTNRGLLEATAGTGLFLRGSTIDQSGGGTLLADGANVVLDTANGGPSDIIGGTLTAEAGGAFTFSNGGSVTFDGTDAAGLTLSSGTRFGVGQNVTLVLAAGAGQTSNIINHGTIALTNNGNPQSGYAYIQAGAAAGGTVRLSGGGSITMTGAANGVTGGAASGFDTLENVDNTISGQGLFDANGGIVVQNDANGVIDANIAGGQFLFETGRTVINNGELEAAGGTLNMTDAVAGTGYAAVSAGGTLDFTAAFDENIDFQGAGRVDISLPYNGTISGFGSDDVIDLASLKFNGSASSVSISNGTAANTYDVTIAEGSASQTLIVSQSTPARLSEFSVSADANGRTQVSFKGLPTPGDFNGDGLADILFRNGANGETYLWEMNGTNVVSGAPTSTQVGNNWQIGGVGDFNGDGQADLLWVYDNTSNAADPLNGVSYISMQNGPNATAASGVVEQLSTNWKVAGIGDFTGSGISDILYRYDNAANAADPLNGLTYIDMMNGTQINWATSGFTSLQLTNPDWNIVSVADVSGSGQAAILWQYEDTTSPIDPLNGALYEWQMNGTNVASSGLLRLEQFSSNWKVQGTGDFNGDGTADILLRYENSGNAADPLNGQTEIEFVGGSGSPAITATSQQVDNSWQVAGIGDYNGDGEADILWQQASTGSTYIWEMNGASVTSGALTSEQTGLGWSVQNGVHIQG